MARGCQWGHGNCEFCVCFMCCSLQRQKFAVVRHERQQKNPPWLVEARARGVANAWIIFVVLIYPSLQPQRDEFAAVVREKQSWFRDRMCNRITAHARLCDYHLVRALPRQPRHRSRDTIEHQGAFPGKRMLMTGNSLIRDRRRATKLLRVSGINWPWGWFGSSSKRQKRAQNHQMYSEQKIVIYKKSR